MSNIVLKSGHFTLTFSSPDEGGAAGGEPVSERSIVPCVVIASGAKGDGVISGPVKQQATVKRLVKGAGGGWKSLSIDRDTNYPEGGLSTLRVSSLQTTSTRDPDRTGQQEGGNGSGGGDAARQEHQFDMIDSADQITFWKVENGGAKSNVFPGKTPQEVLGRFDASLDRRLAIFFMSHADAMSWLVDHGEIYSKFATVEIVGVKVAGLA